LTGLEPPELNTTSELMSYDVDAEHLGALA
jgi:hypothetical protein